MGEGRGSSGHQGGMRARFFLLALIAAPGCAAVAQAFPERPVRMIVPQAAGSATDTVARLLAADGAEAVGSSPEEFAAFIKSESEKWAKVASAAGIKPE